MNMVKGISQILTLAAVLSSGGFLGESVQAESPVKLKGSGAIEFATEGPAGFGLTGTASHLGRYVCYGELAFLPGEDPGSLEGAGVAVFETANRDLLVGVVTCELDGSGPGNMAFHWRDSVQLSNGTTVASSGRFVQSRPPGAAILIQYRPTPLGIIAILIGL